MLGLHGRRASALAVSVACAVGFAACGSDADEKGASGGGGTSATSNAAAKARAAAAVARYVGKPGPFPVRTPLKHRPSGARVAWIQCAAPFCSLLTPMVKQAAATMGLQLFTVKGGFTGPELARAWNAALQQKPDGILNPATEAVLIRDPLARAKAAGIPVVTAGIADTKAHGVNIEITGAAQHEFVGKLQADWVYNRYGDDANIAYAYTPELGYTRPLLASFEREMKSLCPDCPVRRVKVPIATIGTTAPKLIVDDLRRNPKTNVVLASAGDNFNGLPAALKVANINVDLVSYAGTPITHDYVKKGQVVVDLAVDVPALAWSLVDGIAREIDKEKLPPEVTKSVLPVQFLEQKDMTFDYRKGWTAYPDFVERWKRLWGLAG
jgi:ribose transport system substrate-binding protein